MSGIKITKYDRVLRQLLLRKQNYTCQRCGKQYAPDNCAGLHASHFHTRGAWSTRLDFDNVDLHCMGCHSYFEGRPHEFTEWKKTRLGEDKYWQLVRKANTPSKKSLWLDEWYEWAREVFAQVEEQEKEGVTDFSWIDNEIR